MHLSLIFSLLSVMENLLHIYEQSFILIARKVNEVTYNVLDSTLTDVRFQGENRVSLVQSGQQHIMLKVYFWIIILVQ